MKRSDAIELINSVLMDKDTDAWQYGEFHKLAPNVLDILEEAGMSPPQLTLMDKFGSRFLHRVWEPEDINYSTKGVF